MIEAWIVIRSEKHLDDKFWVCLDRDDALRIASDVTSYWKGQYAGELARFFGDIGIDTDLLGQFVFNYNMEESFWVRCEPVTIRESGESEQPK